MVWYLWYSLNLNSTLNDKRICFLKRQLCSYPLWAILAHSHSILTYSHQFLSKVSPDSPMLIPLHQFFTNISVSPSTLYHSHTLLIAPTHIYSLWPALTHLHLIVSKTSPHSPTLIHLRLFFTKINPHLSILLHFHPIFTKISLHLQTVTHSQPFFLKVSPHLLALTQSKHFFCSSK